MVAGELYFAGDAELVADRKHCERLQNAFNAEPDGDVRTRMLGEWLGAFGADSEIRPPFYCDYGYNIRVGEAVFVNFGCVVLDVVPVTIGDRVQIASGVHLLAADHPLDAKERASGQEFGRPITLEDDVWLGGGVVVLPGVTIGAASVIGAGSVVTKDIPAGVVAVGNPCRVVRKL